MLIKSNMLFNSFVKQSTNGKKIQETFESKTSKRFSKNINDTRQNENSSSDEMVRITTMLEIIRQKNRKKTEIKNVNDTEKINIHNIQRSKRSLKSTNESSMNSTDSTNIAKNVFTSEGFYRHPRLSYEEERELFEKAEKLTDGDEITVKNINVNPAEKLTIKYVTVFPPCNDTDVEDGKNQNNLAVLESVEEQRKNKIFVNLQDHQTNNGVTPSDISVYNPDNIPYVEVPDYSDIQEESLDEKDRQSNKKKEQYLKTDIEGTSNPSKVNASVFYLRVKNEEESNIEQSSAAPISNSNSEKKSSKKVQSSGDENLGSQEESNETQENSTAKFEPVVFNINEYDKPFNLDEFLKNDPILKRLELFWDSTSDTYPRYQPKNVEEYQDYWKQEYDSIENRENVDKQYKPSGPSEDYDHDDFVETVLKTKKQTPSATSSIKTEDEFLSRYFTDDIIKKLQKHTSNKKNTKIKDESQYIPDMQKTLSTILKKKDYISRLNDDIDKRIKNGGKPPTTYKHFWVLEYNSPKE